MERYYKTSKKSETGLKIKAIFDRADEFDKQVDRLREKYGFKGVWKNEFYISSLSAVNFDEEPDMKIWKKVKGTDGYYPRVKCKDKELQKDFEDLNSTRVRRDEIDKAIGGSGFPHNAGFYPSSHDIYMFMIRDEYKYNIPEDCQEITNIEFSELRKEKP